MISEVTESQFEAIGRFREENRISVEYLDQGFTFDLIITEQAGNETASIRITNSHTNLVYEEKNGEVLLNLPVTDEGEEGLTDRSILNLSDIWEFATNCDIIDIKALLERQIQYNMSIAEEGFAHAYGANIGRVLLETRSGMENRAAAMAAAGSDARMNGCEMPVIINSGSGNQGITCSVPVIVYARELGTDKEKLYRALTLSNLLTIYQKTGIGRLSAFCGAVCAGVAAGAGIAYLKGGDGLVVKGADNTIRNIGRLGKEGMKKTNEEIIRMMIGR